MPKVIFKIETSHHEGYCTDNECEYDCWEEVIDVDDLEEDTLRKAETQINLRYVCQGLTGSGICLQDSESIENGLERHDSKVTVVDVVPHTKVARAFETPKTLKN